MTDVIFIGAGPIGLLGAIQLKLECPELQMLMFEKYQHPIRNHAMYVDSCVFQRMNRTQGFGGVLDSIPSKVIICDLENTLRAYAVSIGIRIQYQEIKEFNDLTKRYPDTQYFVGSGGLRGVIHQQVFHGEDQINVPIRFAVEVKYKAVGPVRSLNQLVEVPIVLAHSNHLVSEYVGHVKEGLTPIALRIFINESTYQAMKNATFKNPYTLADQDKIPINLFDTIKTYLRSRQELASEIIKENSLKISTISLSLYSSKHFCKQAEGKTMFQIGEEAFACPFYRSFNDNASCIHFFTKAITAKLKGNTIKKLMGLNSFFSSCDVILEEDPLDYYEKKIQQMVNIETLHVHCLNTGIGLIEGSVSSSKSATKLSSSSLHCLTGGKKLLDKNNTNQSLDTEENNFVSHCILS